MCVGTFQVPAELGLLHVRGQGGQLAEGQQGLFLGEVARLSVSLAAQRLVGLGT